MMQVDILSQRPLDYAHPDHRPQLLGIANRSLINALMAMAPLRDFMNDRAESVLGEPEDIAIGNLTLLLDVINADLETMVQMSRIIAVLVHAPSLAASTDGQVLSLIVQHAGTRKVMPRLRELDGLDFKILPHTPHVTQEILDLYSQQVHRFLLGLIPMRLLQRVILRFPEGTLPNPDSLENRPEDRVAFLNLVSVALSILSETKAEAAQQVEAENAEN